MSLNTTGVARRRRGPALEEALLDAAWAELTDRGLTQASDAACQFRDRPIRAIYASDLRRARQTAAAFAVASLLALLALVTLVLKVVLEDRLVEE